MSADDGFGYLRLRFCGEQPEAFAVINGFEDEPAVLGAYPKRPFQRGHCRVLPGQLDVEEGETERLQLSTKSVKHSTNAIGSLRCVSVSEGYGSR
jgi:hypothetical protein